MTATASGDLVPAATCPVRSATSNPPPCGFDHRSRKPSGHQPDNLCPSVCRWIPTDPDFKYNFFRRGRRVCNIARRRYQSRFGIAKPSATRFAARPPSRCSPFAAQHYRPIVSLCCRGGLPPKSVTIHPLGLLPRPLAVQCPPDRPDLESAVCSRVPRVCRVSSGHPARSTRLQSVATCALCRQTSHCPDCSLFGRVRNEGATIGRKVKAVSHVPTPLAVADSALKRLARQFPCIHVAGPMVGFRVTFPAKPHRSRSAP